MPWLPELFSAPALAKVWEEQERRRRRVVPFFPGLMTGETKALARSFAGEPEMHHPVRGRIKGVVAFEQWARQASEWFAEHDLVVEDVGWVLTPARGIEELVLHLDAEDGRYGLPVAIASDHDELGRITDQRIYFSTWPTARRHAFRPPVLQPVDGSHAADVVGEYQQALAAGDADGAVAAFDPEGYVREPAGDDYVHRGSKEVRALFERFFSNGGGIQLEHCAITDDGESCALEYNVVGWGRTELPPQAGLAVYVRGASGKLAAARIYDDVDPPL